MIGLETNFTHAFLCSAKKKIRCFAAKKLTLIVFFLFSVIFENSVDFQLGNHIILDSFCVERFCKKLHSLNILGLSSNNQQLNTFTSVRWDIR